MNCVSSFCTISASEKWPSQSSRMMRPVPSTRIAPSGKSTTGASVVPPQRHPGANFGTLASVSFGMLLSVRLETLVSVSSATVALNPKSARRRPAGLDIRKIERVELRPENVTLVAQCLDDALLLGARRGVVEHVLEREGGVFRSLRQPGLEVVERGSEPGIVLAHFLHAQRDQIARKKFGQRRSDTLQKWPRAHQVEILVSDKARSRQNLSRAHYPLTIETGRF